MQQGDGCGLEDIPQTVLIVGTDAAGKDHLANIIESMILEAGGEVEKRKRYLTGKVTSERSSAAKNSLELLAEKLFLLLFPLFSLLMPPVLHFFLKRDLADYEKTHKKQIVIGHNCLRGFAFYWAHRYSDTQQVKMHGRLKESLMAMRSISDMHVIVLDVEDHIRKKRIAARIQAGDIDNFDRYMAADSERSERIERFLVWLCREHVDAQLIENNDLSESELRRILIRGFKDWQIRY